jgi:transketolase C-terminal domain/subunit
MRNAFAEELLSLARMDPRVVLLSADIGNRLFDKLKAEFPDRFYNCGVAEANMIGVAEDGEVLVEPHFALSPLGAFAFLLLEAG